MNNPISNAIFLTKLWPDLSKLAQHIRWPIEHTTAPAKNRVFRLNLLTINM